MLILLLPFITIYAQGIKAIDSNNVSVSLNEFKYINTAIAEKLQLEDLIVLKDYQISLLKNSLQKMDSVVSIKNNQLDLYKKENEELQPTIWAKLKEYGFFIGFTIGAILFRK